MANFEWKCDFCGAHQVVTDGTSFSNETHIDVGVTKYGRVGVGIVGIRCANPNCNEIALTTEFRKWGQKSNGYHGLVGAELGQWTLRPESLAKPQPSYIPAPLREDYFEACLIRDKSPKASATLARRCLQGMIRDFCGISKNRLIDEIKELKAQVDSGNAPKGVEAETVEAIDSIREIGNIGAHMEKDISLIVEVDPGEAQALIELIEMLFEEWYTARHIRQQKLDKIKAVAAEKQAVIAEFKAAKAQAVIAPPAPDGDAA